MDIKKIIVKAISDLAEESCGKTITEQQIIYIPNSHHYRSDISIRLPGILHLFGGRSLTEIAANIVNKVNKTKHLISEFHHTCGYINFAYSNNAICEILKDLNSEHFFFAEPNSVPETVILEYASPNTNKPLHMGHVRNILLGEALKNILESIGKKVITTCLMNDRGVHICKSMVAYRHWGNEQTPESTGIKGDHFVGKFYVMFEKEYKKQQEELKQQYLKEGLNWINAENKAVEEAPLIKEAQEMLVKWEKMDVETLKLWNKLNSWVYDGFNATFKKLGARFSLFNYESNTYLKGLEEIQRGLKERLFYKGDGQSVWVNLSAYDLGQKLLIRKDGTSVYITQDIGTVKKRLESFSNIDSMIYVVGNEQRYHFEALFTILKLLGISKDINMLHYAHGMINLPNGRMKSREGTVVDADDLIQELEEKALVKIEESDKFKNDADFEKQKIAEQIGLGALKFFILKTSFYKNTLFDPEKSIDLKGCSGPFVQYSFVRASKITDLMYKDIWNVWTREEDFNSFFENSNLSFSTDLKRLILQIYDYKRILNKAATDLSPNILVDYCYNLAKEFNRFYTEYKIITAEDETERRLNTAITYFVRRCIGAVLIILGIPLPDKM